MNLEERVAFLEGRVDQHARQTDGIREGYFVWILGAQVTTLAAVVTAFAVR